MTNAVEILQALGDRTRLRIFALLGRMELAVGELAQVLGQSQPRVSRHVRILCDAGLAERRREGSWVFLVPARTAAAAAATTFVAELLDGADAAWRAADDTRLAEVRGDRAAAAARYFDAHAPHWDALRALHVDDSAVEARLTALLPSALGRLVDLGTGTGRMIELLGDAASHSIGLDRSPEMLRFARAKLSTRPDWELRHGDVTAVPLADASADTVIVHQVLHYLAAPDRALREGARLLSTGGRMVIVDFASHEREELRSDAAHARLGFSDAQIADWLAEVGLVLDRVEALAGEPLTVKIWLASRAPAAKALAA